MTQQRQFELPRDAFRDLIETIDNELTRKFFLMQLLG